MLMTFNAGFMNLKNMIVSAVWKHLTDTEKNLLQMHAENKSYNAIMKKNYQDYIGWRTARYLQTESVLKKDSKILSHLTLPFAQNAGDTVLSYCVRRTLERVRAQGWGGAGRLFLELDTRS